MRQKTKPDLERTVMRQAARIAHVQAVGRDALKQQTRDGLRLAVS